ncbi:MAG: hypothetical protein IJ083_06055 [Clostridia bacterium]|nr:hypothetical protein [Clostridia bacterium]
MYRRFMSLFLVLALCLGCMAACSTAAAEEEEDNRTYSLDFDQQKNWTIETKKKVTYGYTKMVYCEHPTHPGYQAINMYVPAEYLNEDGSVNTEAKVGDYTALTAPILYINSVGAYLGVAPYKLKSTVTRAGQNLWYYNYLKKGFVIAFAGARGRTQNVELPDGTAQAVGKAPIGLVDLKAGIRFLKANAGKFPGDTGKIISNGMSAGGAMSVLLGVTGNSGIYTPYLEEIGACMDQTDDVYAVQAYCPIIDLENASQAYEWMFGSHESRDYPQTDFTKAFSAAMAKQYTERLNGLELGFDLEADGKGGSFYDWLLNQYEAGFEAYVQRGNDPKKDTDTWEWLSYDETDGKAKVASLDDLISSGYISRSKNVGAFDAYDCSTAENSEFGKLGAIVGTEEEKRHFSTAMADLLGTLAGDFPEESAEYAEKYETSRDADIQAQVWAMNPYHFVEDGDTTKAQHFRICVGTKDTDTAPVIAASFALLLKKAGIDTTYELIWNEIHTDAEYENGFEDWVDSVCR